MSGYPEVGGRGGTESLSSGAAVCECLPRALLAPWHCLLTDWLLPVCPRGALVLVVAAARPAAADRIEVEQKYPLPDQQALEDRVRAMGGKFKGERGSYQRGGQGGQASLTTTRGVVVVCRQARW